MKRLLNIRVRNVAIITLVVGIVSALVAEFIKIELAKLEFSYTWDNGDPHSINSFLVVAILVSMLAAIILLFVDGCKLENENEKLRQSEGQHDLKQSELSGDPKQLLTAHDEEINKRICDDMERFKDLVNGGLEKLEHYFGRDSSLDIEGDYDFLDDLSSFLRVTLNRFVNPELESLREKLADAIREFLHFQAYHTHQYFLDIGNKAYCTKLYLIENHPERCMEYNLPCVDDIYSESNRSIAEPFISESKQYRDLARKAINCYNDLEDCFLTLVD